MDDHRGEIEGERLSLMVVLAGYWWTCRMATVEMTLPDGGYIR